MNFHKIKIAVIILTAVFFVFDRYFKSVAIFYADSSINLLGDIFKFNFARNYNIAFSLPLYGIGLNILILIIVASLLVYCLKLFYDKKNLEAILVGCIILGASSNLFDRFKYGYVIDYLDLKYFTVFNLADVMIVCPVILLILVNYFKKS